MYGVSLFNLEGILRRADPYGGIAQLGERLPCKQEVSGSIPLVSTMLSLKAGYQHLKDRMLISGFNDQNCTLKTEHCS